EHQPYSFCVRNTVVYECLSYAADGSVRRTRRQAVAHGTAFAYRQEAATGTTLLFTNEHVAEWPAVTPDGKTADGVPAGCKRVSENLRIVDNEQDDYEADDVSLTRIVADPQLDAPVLRAKATLPVLPSKCAAFRSAPSPPPTSARWSRRSSTTTKASGITTTSWSTRCCRTATRDRRSWPFRARPGSSSSSGCIMRGTCRGQRSTSSSGSISCAT